MRILQWAFPHHQPLGGREVFTERLSSSLLGAGHEVLLFGSALSSDSPIHTIETTKSGLTLHRFNLDSFGRQPHITTGTTGVGGVAEISVLAALKKVIDGFAPDLIHLHNFYSQSSVFLASYLRAHRRKIPTVYTIHDVATLAKIPNSLGGEIVGNATDAIVCPSQYIYQRLEMQKGIGKKKVVVIENGVPDQGSNPKNVGGSLKVFSAANLHNHKGFVILLSAWAKISKDFPGATLTLAGDGPERIFLEDYCEKLGIAETVSFIGWLSEEQFFQTLQSHSIVVVPSLVAEAFGLVAAEAQMAGISVIASSIGGLKEIVEDGSTGILSSAGSVSELSDALIALLGNTTLRVKMGSAGRERALQFFDMKTCVTRYLQLYESMLTV